MIDEILHSVEKAENEAEKKVESARKKAEDITKEAKEKAVVTVKEYKKTLKQEADCRLNLVVNEEKQKDEEELNAVMIEIDSIKEKAKNKEDEIISKLVTQLV